MNATAHLHELPLPGLRDDNPRDFLAALGLLRLVDLLWPELKPALSWVGSPRIPVLSSLPSLPVEWAAELVDAAKKLVSHPDHPITHGDIIKTSYSQFRKAVENAVSFAGSDQPFSRLPLLLYASYSSQLEDEAGNVDPTGLSFANGQSGKKLLLDVTQLITSLDADRLLGTLNGEAEPVAAKSLRWNPSEFRPAAYRSHDPGSKLKGDETKDHPALNVLAFFGLTFFPVAPMKEGGKTSGLHDNRQNRYFHWPVWTAPLITDEIATLVCVSPIHMKSESGIDQVWRSRRFSSDKSLYFAPAESVR